MSHEAIQRNRVPDAHRLGGDRRGVRARLRGGLVHAMSDRVTREDIQAAYMDAEEACSSRQARGIGMLLCEIRDLLEVQAKEARDRATFEENERAVAAAVGRMTPEQVEAQASAEHARPIGVARVRAFEDWIKHKRPRFETRTECGDSFGPAHNVFSNYDDHAFTERVEGPEDE